MGENCGFSCASVTAITEENDASFKEDHQVVFLSEESKKKREKLLEIIEEGREISGLNSNLNLEQFSKKKFKK